MTWYYVYLLECADGTNYTESTFYPCDSLDSFSKKSSGIFLTDETGYNNMNNEIKLNFYLFETGFDIRIYPNPGKGLFSIEVLTYEPDVEIQMTIYDQFGKEVYVEPIFEKQIFLNLSHLSKGIYYLQFKNVVQRFTRKLIII